MTSLFLRPWVQDDAGALQAAYQGSADLARQLDADAGEASGACRVIREDLGWDPLAGCNLAIEAGGEAVGNVGIRAMDFHHGSAWVYYWLALPARGKGLASRSLASMARWAFDELQLHRLELGHRTDNPASCQVALAAGFLPEGIQRGKLRYGADRFDVETHARLAADPVPDLLPIDLRV